MFKLYQEFNLLKSNVIFVGQSRFVDVTPHAIKSNCPCSIDGVPESKQSTTTLLVVSIRFCGDCRKVYPTAIGIGGKIESTLTVELMLSKVIEDINANNLTVRVVIADAPMRAKCRNVVGHSGYYVSEAN